MLEDVTAAVVNYQTPDLLETAVRSFNDAYPEVAILVVDNGSHDDSPAVVSRLADRCTPVRPLLLDENVYHGPAMDRAMHAVDTRFVYLFDSDTETRAGGFLEPMMALVDASEGGYGAGQVVHVDRRGFVAAEGIPVLASWHMMLRRDVYLQLPPFIHHGLPTLHNFKAAHERGLELFDFPIADYVHHLGRGTADRFGYGLGWRSRLDYLLHRLGL